MHFLISLIKVFFFVPYRGTTFLNTLCQTYARQTESGFRFLSGSYISQFITSIVSTILKFWFPSPIGELHFSIRKGKRMRKIFWVSVSYRGATFLNRSNNINILHTSVSVPYRGATFLNDIRQFFGAFTGSFRPLSGSYISQ